MVRVKRGFVARRKRKKVLQKAKGFRRTIRTQIRTAKQAVFKAGVHATKDRRGKKRVMRRMWIARLNAAAREFGLKYSTLINLLKKAKIRIDRRLLADLAMNEPKAFAKIIAAVK